MNSITKTSHLGLFFGPRTPPHQEASGPHPRGASPQTSLASSSRSSRVERLRILPSWLLSLPFRRGASSQFGPLVSSCRRSRVERPRILPSWLLILPFRRGASSQEAAGPHWASLGLPGSAWASWASLGLPGPSWAFPGLPGPPWGLPGPPWASLGLRGPGFAIIHSAMSETWPCDVSDRRCCCYHYHRRSHVNYYG